MTEGTRDRALSRRRFLAYAVGTAAMVDPRTAMAKSPPKYPPASGAPGHPFADPNLKLAVMSALLDAGLLDLGTPNELANHVLGREVDLERQGYELLRPVYDYLVRYPLTTAHLDAVRSLVFDGGLSIYPYAKPQWDGETEDFDVRDLTGLAVLRGLERIAASAMIAKVDVAALVGLPSLTAVELFVDVQNIPRLLDLPRLTSVKFMDNDIYRDVHISGHPTRETMLALKRRGAKVWVHWVTHSGAGPRPPAFR